MVARTPAKAPGRAAKVWYGLVVPTGYSFNLDGTNIYMTLATLFIAQALGSISASPSN